MLPKNPIGVINTVLLSNLPSLNNVDLSSIKAISTLCIFQMHNASIKYPALTNVYYAAKNTLEELASKHKISFCLSKNVFEKVRPRISSQVTKQVLEIDIIHTKNMIRSLGAKTSKYKLLFTIN